MASMMQTAPYRAIADSSKLPQISSSRSLARRGLATAGQPARSRQDCPAAWFMAARAWR